MEEYIDLASRKSELERTELQKEKTGVFTGCYARNPVNGESIPIWVADYVLGRSVRLGFENFVVGFSVNVCHIYLYVVAKTKCIVISFIC